MTSAKIVLRGALLTACCLAGLSARAASWSVVPVGRFDFFDSHASELGGISRVTNAPAGTLYYAASDNTFNAFFPMTISVNGVTGAVTSASIGSSLPLLNSALDLEGLGYDAAGNSVYLANESQPGIRRHAVSNGALLASAVPSSHPQLNAFSNIVSNRGFESLGISGDAQTIWTTTQSPLSTDSSPNATMRLQRLDGNLNPTGQWAYDVLPGVAGWSNVSGAEVKDLLVLPDGKLAVMEQVEGTLPNNTQQLVTRLFEVNFAGATNLNGGTISGATRVAKTLLWQGVFNPNDDGANFEGIALGPQLNDGTRSILLIADTGSSNHTMYALKLVPEPSGFALACCALGIACGCGWIGRRTRTR